MTRTSGASSSSAELDTVTLPASTRGAASASESAAPQDRGVNLQEAPSSSLADAVNRIDAAVVGRHREAELVVAALHSGRHLLLEGPPGTGKTTMLQALAAALDMPMVAVEGSAELTPGRLAGQFDPSRVLADGYSADSFLEGPLVEAMRAGALLYLEELNRVPEETVNLLIAALSEGELNLPRIGRIPAAADFRLVAAMNPYDTVGTARISGAVYDRLCRVSVGYQSLEDERAIVERETAPLEAAAAADDEHSAAPQERDRLVQRAVTAVRATRFHDEIRMGCSVRGAIDLVEVAQRLAELRGAPVSDRCLGLDAALLALSGRIRTHEGGDRTHEEIITEIWDDVLAAEAADERGRDNSGPSDAAGETGTAGGPAGLQPGKGPGPEGPSEPGARP